MVFQVPGDGVRAGVQALPGQLLSVVPDGSGMNCLTGQGGKSAAFGYRVPRCALADVGHAFPSGSTGNLPKSPVSMLAPR